MDPNQYIYTFELYGLDFMIDENYKPWLIEVNNNPCLETSCLLLNRIIPSVVENVLRIAVDPMFPPPIKV
jgi:tubulin--tyrosine ligase